MMQRRLDKALTLSRIAIIGALSIATARGQSYSWTGGSGHWGEPANWTPTGVPDAAGAVATVPSTASGIIVTVADATGDAATFTVGRFVFDQVTQNRSFGNPTSGTSTIIFNNGASTAELSARLSGSNRIVGIPDRVSVQLGSSLFRTLDDGNFGTVFQFDGLVSGAGNFPSRGRR